MELIDAILENIDMKYESGEISADEKDILYATAYERYMENDEDEMTTDEYLDALESAILDNENDDDSMTTDEYLDALESAILDNENDDDEITVDDVMEAVEDGVISKEDAYDLLMG